MSYFAFGDYGHEDRKRVVRIDPVTASTEVLFATPYSYIKGFALKPPSSFISWINADGQGHFYAETDLTSHTTVPLGHTDGNFDYVFATVFEDFPMKGEAPARSSIPSTFSYERVVETISDPYGVVGGDILPGDQFTGEFSYDASAPYTLRYPNGHPPYGLSLHFNGSDYIFDGLIASISNNYYRPAYFTLSDNFDLETHINDVIRVTWHLEDPTMRALSGNAMLPTRFALPKWSTNEFVITFYNPEGHRLYTVSGRVDRIRRLRR